MNNNTNRNTDKTGDVTTLLLFVVIMNVKILRFLIIQDFMI